MLLVIFLLALFSLFAGNQEKAISLDFIDQYEHAGDYATALELAHALYETSFESYTNQQVMRLDKIIKHLETAHLKYGSSKRLFDEQYKPREPLLELLHLVGMERSHDLGKIHHWTQSNLLRQGERWEKQSTRFDAIREELIPLLDQLGFVKGTSAHFQHYEGAIVYGALLSRVRMRLDYLVEQWKAGVRFDQLYFLSGERPLEPLYENEDTLAQVQTSPLKKSKDLARPKTESDMVKWVWEQSEIPNDMRTHVKVHFITAAMKKDQETDTMVRPNAIDTIIAWLKSSPLHGRYLAVTNAPYINRYDYTARRIAPKEYQFDTIGPSANQQERIAIYLDELTRLICEVIHKLIQESFLTSPASALSNRGQAGYIYLRILTCLPPIQNCGADFARN